MKKPCENCPFRSDRPFRGLSKVRCLEIADTLFKDGSFHCHKTLDYSKGSPQHKKDTELCVGSMIFLENVRPGGIAANLAYRLDMCFKGLRKEHLSKEIPVYKSVKAFIKGVKV